MGYTLGDFDWDKVQKEFGFGYELSFANQNQEEAELEDVEGGISDELLSELDQDYEFEIYKMPESKTDEMERLLSDMESGGYDDARAAAEALKKMGVQPIKTVTVPLVFLNSPYISDRLAFDCDEGIFYEASGDTADSSGGYNDDALFSDGREITCDAIAKQNGGDFAVPMSEFEGSSFSFDREASIEALIDAGCLKERE